MDLDECTSLSCKRLIPLGNPFKGVGKIYGFGVVLTGHRCYLYGGYKRIPNQGRVYLYDIAQNAWSSIKPGNPDLAFGRVKLSFVADDILHAYIWHEIYGYYNFAMLDLIQCEEWRLVPDRDAPKIGTGTAGCYVEARKEAVLFGGSAPSEVEINVYRLQTQSWYSPRAKGQPPRRRWNHAVCTSGERMFVVGGSILGGNRPATLDIHILTMVRAEFTWTSPVVPGFAPPRRYLFQATCSNDRVFVYGGYNGEHCFHIYSVTEEKWYLTDDSGPPEHTIPLRTPWLSGTSENGALQTPTKLWIFGGFQLPIVTPLVISADQS